jgi:hypothetical protein
MKRHVPFALPALASALLIGSACDPGTLSTGPEATEPPEAAATVVAGEALGPAVERDLAALRRLTAPMHRFDHATSEEGGWFVQATNCRENPGVGGMGYHYANPAYLDGVVEVEKPEILMYEPRKNGGMRLVGVEYIIPFVILGPESEAPTLMGQTFQQNFSDGVWMLHVWLWQDNPRGIFENWNPTVSCEYAAD